MHAFGREIVNNIHYFTLNEQNYSLIDQLLQEYIVEQYICLSQLFNKKMHIVYITPYMSLFSTQKVGIPNQKVGGQKNC